jgi:hypothetical protein
VEAIFAKLVVLCSLLVNGICSNMLWNLRQFTLEQFLVFVCQTYRRVERRIEECNVCCFGQLFMNSLNDSQGTCIVAVKLVSSVIRYWD